MLLLKLAHVVVDGAARRAGEHHRPAAARVPERESDGRSAAHRLRHDRGPFDLEQVEQRAQIVVEGGAAALLVALAVARPAERAVVEGDAAIALREHRHLLPPAEVVAAGAVREDDGGPVPCDS